MMRCILVFLFSAISILNILGQDCLTEAVLENNSTKTIPTDGSCDSPVDDGMICNIATINNWRINGTTTVLPCATVNLTDAAGGNSQVINGATFVIEVGATVTFGRTFRARGNVIVNGTLIIGNGAGNDGFEIGNSGSVTVGSTGTISITNSGTGQVTDILGSLTIDQGGILTTNRSLSVGAGNNSGTLVVNGTLNIGDGVGSDDLFTEAGSTVTVGSNGNINITNGYVDIADGATGTTFMLNGTLTQAGSSTNNGINLNGLGALQGTGFLQFADQFNLNGGTADGAFNDCINGSTGSCGDPSLPVELVSFDSEKNDHNSILLTWTTASETNNSGFYVEKSFDGIDFFELAFVKGQGTDNRTNHYSYEDVEFLKTCYYRLRQVDYDGAFEYSSVLFDSFDQSEYHKIQVYPNPVTNFVSLSGSGETFDVLLFKINGETILQMGSKKLHEIEDEVNNAIIHLDEGIVFLRLFNGNFSFTEKILIVK